MKTRLLAAATLTLALSGCVTGYTLVTPGLATVGPLTVNASAGYNLAPTMFVGGQRKGAQTWTKDGLLLDRLTIIPEVPDGETLLVSRAKDAALPVFRKDMLPNELEELVQSTLTKLFGEGEAVVGTSNLRPHRFGEHRGILFDVAATVSESPEYKGVVGAFIVDEKLNVMWYIAADPFYFDRHRAAAEAIIMSARLAAPAGAS